MPGQDARRPATLLRSLRGRERRQRKPEGQGDAVGTLSDVAAPEAACRGSDRAFAEIADGLASTAPWAVERPGNRLVIDLAAIGPAR